MIRINLMPRAEARRQAARQRDKQVATLITAGLALVLLSTEIFTRREANAVQDEADRYQAELADLTKRHQEATLLDKKRTQLRAKLATIEVLERQRRGPVHVLDDLSESTPEKLWLTEMRESGGGMTLLGKGLDNQTIAQFMRKLAASRFFENVDLVETKQVEEGQAKLKQFTISARVNYAGRTPREAEQAAGSAAGSPPAAAPRAGARGGDAAAGAEGAAAGPGGASGSTGSAGSSGPAGSDGPSGSGAPSGEPARAGVATGRSALDGAGPISGAVAARDAVRAAAGATEGRQIAEAAEAADPAPAGDER
jgi:type IV pilus assembly protein PilN